MTLPSVLLTDDRSPFWESPGYVETTKEAIVNRKSLKVVHEWSNTSTLSRIVKIALAILIPIIGLYYIGHWLIGKLIFIKALVSRVKVEQPDGTFKAMTHKQMREAFVEREVNAPQDENSIVYKEVPLKVNGRTLFVTMAGTAKTFRERRYAIWQMGKRECKEFELLCKENVKNMVHKLGATVLIANYPGVDSSGFLTQKAAVNAHTAMLDFIENKLEAREVICKGHSYGTLIQAKSVQQHKFKSETKWVVISGRGFNNFADAVNHHHGLSKYAFVRKFLSWLGIIFGWNGDVVAMTKQIGDRHVVIQSTKKDKHDVVTDGIIRPESDLHQVLIRSGSNHDFVGVDLGHDNSMPADKWQELANLVNRKLSPTL